MVGSGTHCRWHFSRFKKISLLFWNVIFRGRCNIWQCWGMTPVAPCNVSFQPFSQKMSLIFWNVIFRCSGNSLMILDSGSCCSAQCKWRFSRLPKISLIFWSVVFVAGASIWWSWTVTPVAPLTVNDVSAVSQKFLWYFGASFFVAGAIIWWSWTVTPVAPLTVNDVPAVFQKFLWYFGVSCFVGGAIFGDIGRCFRCSAQCKWRLCRFQDNSLLLESHFS